MLVVFTLYFRLLFEMTSAVSPPQRFPGIFQGGPAGEQARAINILEDW